MQTVDYYLCPSQTRIPATQNGTKSPSPTNAFCAMGASLGELHPRYHHVRAFACSSILSHLGYHPGLSVARSPASSQDNRALPIVHH